MSMIPVMLISPLAQDVGGLSFGALVTCLAILVLAIIGMAVVRYVRAWSKQTDFPATGGFTLSQLRKLRQEGKMTDAEYQKASALIVKAQTAQVPTANPGAGGAATGGTHRDLPGKRR